MACAQLGATARGKRGTSDPVAKVINLEVKTKNFSNGFVCLNIG